MRSRRLTAALAALRARGVQLYTPAERGVDRRGYEGTVPVERILKIVPQERLPTPVSPAEDAKAMAEDWRAVGDDLRSVMGTPKAAPPRLHPHYLSTYCHHWEHSRCRRTCKVCERPCVCPCHQDEPA